MHCCIVLVSLPPNKTLTADFRTVFKSRTWECRNPMHQSSQIMVSKKCHLRTNKQLLLWSNHAALLLDVGKQSC